MAEIMHENNWWIGYRVRSKYFHIRIIPKRSFQFWNQMTPREFDKLSVILAGYKNLKVYIEPATKNKRFIIHVAQEFPVLDESPLTKYQRGLKSQRLRHE